MKKKSFLFVAALSTLALVSCGSFNYAGAARGAAVGAAAAYDGYTLIGYKNSSSECEALAKSKGYTYYLFDTATGACYAK